jgi:hypothetical protein
MCVLKSACDLYLCRGFSASSTSKLDDLQLNSMHLNFQWMSVDKMCVLKSACVFHLCRAGIAGLLPQIRADITAHATDNPLSQAICTELLVMLELVRECVVSETKAHNHYNFVSAHF